MPAQPTAPPSADEPASLGDVSTPTGEVIDVPSTVPADCSADATKALEAWFASVPDDSTMRLAAGGCYRIDGTLHITARNRLLLDGNGATLRAEGDGDRDRRHLRVVGGSHILLRNFTVEGVNPKAGATADSYRADRAFQHGIALDSVAGALVEHVTIRNVYGDFVYIGRADGRPTATSVGSNITIRDSTFEGSGRQGVAIAMGNGILITGNTIGGVGRSMFDLEPNTANQAIRDVSIVANHTGAARNFWLANKGQGFMIGPVTIRANVMDAPTGGLVFSFHDDAGGARGPWTIEDNVLIASDKVHDEGSRGAFFFTGSTDVTIRGNRVSFAAAPGMPAVELQRSSNVTIEGNTFEGAGQVVVADAASSNVHAPGD